MNTKIVATNYQMQEWMDIIRDCRNSGLTVQQYCDEKNLSRPTYYYWLNKIRKAALESVDSSPAFVELKPPAPVSRSTALVSIHVGEATIDLPENISDEFLIRILKAVAYVK